MSFFGRKRKRVRDLQVEKVLLEHEAELDDLERRVRLLEAATQAYRKRVKKTIEEVRAV